MSINPQRAPKNDRGFALLITITLLAFLVLLLVSLASLTRVETQVAANNQQIAQARQNALMAMNVALGRLQQLAGPDQRVTGTADLVAGRDDSKKNWTGVWAPITNAATGITTPDPRGWLVSGTAATGASGVTGALSAAAGNSLVDLVGINTTGSTVAADNVKAETEPVKIKGMPGFDPATEVQIGNFAYWVGDEGVKAKVSLTDPWESPSQDLKDATGVNDTTASIYRFLGTQRTGVEGVGKNAADDRVSSAYPFDPSINPVAYQEFKAGLPKVLSPRQLAMANPAGSIDLASAAKARFHDLTASSFSVMTNVADGGLKKDLTAWLAQPDGPANPPRDNDYITGNSAYLPKWSLIRDYAGTVADGAAKPAVAQDTVPTVAPKQGIHPVITYLRVGYNVSCAGDNEPVAFHLFPTVVLWNPSNVPIEARDYELQLNYVDQYFAIILGKKDTPTSTQRASTVDKIIQNASNVPSGSNAFATLWPAFTEILPAGGMVASLTKKPFRFLLDSGTTRIEPGQSLVFSMDQTGPYQPGVTRLRPDSPINVGHSTILYGPTMTPADLRTDNGPLLPPTPVLYYICNLSGNMDFSLRDAANNAVIYQNVTSPNSLVPFTHSPVHTAFALDGRDPDTIIQPLFLNRSEMYFSQGNHTGVGVTPRWLALTNPRAPDSLRVAGTLNSGSLSYYFDVIGNTNPRPFFGTTNRASAGSGEDVSVSSNPSVPPQDFILQEFLKPQTPLFSIAQLQHANLSLMNLNPAFAVGNSLPNPYVPRHETKLVLDLAQRPGTRIPTHRNITEIYDLSYVLNQALWDKYFFSTVPTSLIDHTQITKDYKLPNSRHVFNWKTNTPTAAELAELKTTDGAAAHLMINGGFNANSTSVQAWRALLYSRNKLATDPADPATYHHPFSRYSDPDAGVSNTDVWKGYRVLSDAQIDRLADKIADEVKTRGPFVSLADFINRRRAKIGDADAATGLKGTLQAAIDSADAVPATSVNPQATFTQAANQITLTPATVIRSHWIGSDVDADVNKPNASRSAFAPGYLSQADLLTALGPLLTARSDTFTIRAYGDVQNPATSAIEGRAWCEAVVQRLPEYMETQNAWAAPTGAVNQAFGRRFRLVSFRWLTERDI